MWRDVEETHRDVKRCWDRSEKKGVKGVKYDKEMGAIQGRDQPLGKGRSVRNGDCERERL